MNKLTLGLGSLALLLCLFGTNEGKTQPKTNLGGTKFIILYCPKIVNIHEIYDLQDKEFTYKGRMATNIEVPIWLQSAPSKRRKEALNLTSTTFKSNPEENTIDIACSYKARYNRSIILSGLLELPNSTAVKSCEASDKCSNKNDTNECITCAIESN